MNFLEVGVRWFSEERCRGCGIRGEGLFCPVCLGVILESGRARRIRYEEKMVMRPEEVFRSARYLGERDGILGEMAEEYKYMSRRGLGAVLAEIVDEIYFRRYLFSKRGMGRAILVPMPTARKHIRARGLDHIFGVAREIERRDERVEVFRFLSRRRDTVQVGASEEKRKMQAKEAVGVDFIEVERRMRKMLSAGEGSEKTVVVVMDDVWTTGASMLYAGKMLGEAIEEMRGMDREGFGERFGDELEERFGERFGGLFGLAITKNRAGKSPEIYMGKF